MLTAKVTKQLDSYRLSDAAKAIYDFAWHRVADVHIEKNKNRFKEGDVQANAVLRHVYFQILKLLHPFMPFVTEEIYGQLSNENKKPLIITSWPV